MIRRGSGVILMFGVMEIRRAAELSARKTLGTDELAEEQLSLGDERAQGRHGLRHGLAAAVGGERDVVGVELGEPEDWGSSLARFITYSSVPGSFSTCSKRGRNAAISSSPLPSFTRNLARNETLGMGASSSAESGS
jgi:hypothetical protein